MAETRVYMVEFQCRERLMGDCYRSDRHVFQWWFLADVSVPRTADGGLLPREDCGGR